MKRFCCVLGSAFLAVAPAQAVVVTGGLTGGTALSNGGVFQIVTPGPGFTVGGNDFGDNNVRAFNEQQGVTLLTDLAVRGGVIAAGTRVNSHFLVFDPSTSRRAIGSVTLSERILGVATTRNLLNGSNFLGSSQVTYNFGNSSGLEGNDIVTFAGDMLSFDLSASSPSDSIRILTAVPEPASWTMLIAGFGLVGAAARRRRTAEPHVIA